MNFKSLAGAIAIAATLATTAAAHAATVLTWTTANVGVAKVLDFNGFDDDGTVKGLSAEITYKLTSVTNGGKTWTFSYDVDNTSTSPLSGSRISGFGFNVDPNVSSATASGVFTKTASGNVPMIGTREVCITGNNCAGGGGGGVSMGNDGLGAFVLNFSSSKTSLSLSDFYVRYQSIYGPGEYGGSAVGQPFTKPVAGVPEPATWAMMLIGFFAIGSAVRNSRRKLALA